MNPHIFYLLQSDLQPRVFGLDMHTFIAMIIQLISVIVLFIVLKKLLHKPISDFLKKREERIESDLQNAEDEKAKAGEFRLEYEQKLKNIEYEKNEILMAARNAASEHMKKSEATAKVEAEAIRSRAYRDVELEQARAKAEVKKAIIETSALMVTKFITRTIDAEMQEQLFNETMAELEDIAWHS